MTTRKTLKKLIKNYSLILANLGFTLNPNFKKDFLHIKRMKTNSTKISFIKKDKIEGLQENIKGFKIKPNDTEQREKYFQAVRPSKFLQSMILPNRDKENLFNQISEQFNKDFINNIKSKLTLYSGDDIAKIYNSASVVGCMARGCESWFKVYAKTENLQLATLTDGDTILMRSLLWYDKETNNYWLDNSYEQSAINGDNTIRKEYQAKLLSQVLNHINKTNSNDYKIGCSFAHNLNSHTLGAIEVEAEHLIYNYNQLQRNNHDDDKITIQPIIKDFDTDNFDCFPYSDTFKSIGRRSGKWFLNSNNGDSDFICCQSTNGEDENNSGQLCNCCDEMINNEDYISFSELEDEYLCDDCSTYISEREDSCRSDNALYNNYTGEYIYRRDLE